MIKSFRHAETQSLFETGKSKRFAGILKVATRKLTQLDAAVTLEFLKSPPGNHLELLKAIERASSAFGSTINGASAFDGQKQDQRMSRLRIITEGGCG